MLNGGLGGLGEMRRIPVLFAKVFSFLEGEGIVPKGSR